jgi:hypothetical protein
MPTHSVLSTLSQIKFWHSLIVAILGGWLAASISIDNISAEIAAMTTLQRLMQPGFLGIVTSHSLATAGVAVLFWLVTNAIRSVKVYAGLGATLAAVLMTLILLVGQTSLKIRSSAPLTSSTPRSPQLQKSDAYAPAKSCQNYKINPLQFLRVGSIVQIVPRAAGCRSLESYESYVDSILSGEKARAIELDRLGVCFQAPNEGAIVRILQIVEVPGGACSMETILTDRADLGTSWTDVSMVDKVVR